MLSNFIKKKISVTAVFLFLTTFIFAQTMDTVKPFTGTKGFRKFSIGVNVGVMTPHVAVGGANDYSKWLVNLGYGANLKYQLNHYLAVQLDGFRGKLKGNQDNNLGNGQTAKNRAVTSFETDLKYGGGIGVVYTIGNINWLSKTNKVIPYIHGGIGMLAYSVDIVNKGTTTPVKYSAKDPIHELYAMGALGLKVNITSMLNLDFGYRMHWVDGDNFDGYNAVTPSKDKFDYGFVGLEFALGKKTKPQLMFHNPAAVMNQDLINQINEVKAMIDEKDSDGDGVTDKWDREPNTPPNCPVDSHGVSKDTDGDGVIDCKDKQLITPTECQPVDADGVGKCPEPACCSKINNPPMEETKTCNIGDLPSLSFKGNTTALNGNAKAMLASVAAKLKDNATCSISVTGYPSTSKASQAVCNQRLEAIKRYLVEKEGISADRITTNCEVGGGDANTVDIKGTNM